MKIKVIGSGWFGCHIALSLSLMGIEVKLHEKYREIFSGASGKIPARLHLGAPHYPRSFITQQACQSHQKEFMKVYGFLTKPVPVNIYAIANDYSNIDFGTYKLIIKNQIESITLYDPEEFGLYNVEGAMMISERHIVISRAKEFFERKLKDILVLNSKDEFSTDSYDYVIDCTFCSQDEYMIDRFEPCLVLLLKGDNPHKAVTIMDGPFPSLYPWDESRSLLSLSSARFSPLSKKCKTWHGAKNFLESYSKADLIHRGNEMIENMAYYYPEVKKCTVVDYMLSIRAMPLSKADTRLVHVHKQTDKLIRIRAGKIDAVLDAEKQIKEIING